MTFALLIQDSLMDTYSRHLMPSLMKFFFTSVLLSPETATFGDPLSDAERCENITDIKLQNTTITAAMATGRKSRLPPSFDEYTNREIIVRPAFCRVSGVIAPSINFEVWLPLPEAWNGRLQGLGNAGMAGSINYRGLSNALEDGYAAASSDLGHKGKPLDGSWAIGRHDLVRDWGHRATHEMTVKAKSLVAAYYGKGPTFSYFNGCSGGGRQGMMEAQRYPNDYDGILTGHPTIDFTRLVVGGRIWQVLANLNESVKSNFIAPEDVKIISDAVIDRCDGLDGVEDGVLEDPRQCGFRPETKKCSDNMKSNCLTTQQVAALKKIYKGPNTREGKSIYPGYEPGGELGRFGWIWYFAGMSPFQGTQWAYAKEFLSGLVFEDPDYDPLTFDYDTDLSKLDDKLIMGKPLPEVIDAVDPDLIGFKANGGKIIHYHGWSDIGVAPQRSIDYYESVIRELGNEKMNRDEALAGIRNFYRLFMVPGMQHCFGGPGPNAFGASFQPRVPREPAHDVLEALKRWVEHGVAPERIIATKYMDDDPQKGVLRTRPLCPYPQRAVYRGKGSTDVARNFICQ